MDTGGAVVENVPKYIGKTTHFSSHVVLVDFEVGHAWPPVVYLEGLGELLAAAVAEASLGQGRRDHVHFVAKVHLDPFWRRVAAHYFGWTPGATTRVSVQPIFHHTN